MAKRRKKSENELRTRLAAAQALSQAPFVDGARWSHPPEAPQAELEFSEVNDRQQRLFLRALAQHPGVQRACRAAGVSVVTGWQWRKDTSNVAFQRALEVAIKLGVEQAEGELWRRGIEGVKKPVYQGGHLVGTVQDYDTTAAIFMLKGAAPEKYRERFEHTGAQGGPMQTETLHTLDASGLEEQLVKLVEQVRGRPVTVLDVTAVPEPGAAVPSVSSPSPVLSAGDLPPQSPLEAYQQALAKRTNGGGHGSGNP